ncbi:MAG: hypothetical protein ACLGP3_02260 [Acidobacteriota bacterium]
MERRSERYPIIGLSLAPERVQRLREMAAKYHYRTRRGPQPGGLAKDLFDWAWPIFEGVEFDPTRLPKRVPDIEALKEWFVGFYSHLPADRRDGIIRSLSDRFNYPAPPRLHGADQSVEGTGQAPKATPRGARRR